MKVLLFNEPSSQYLPLPMRLGFYFPNPGILAIAAYLGKYNYNVKIIDMIASSLTWNDIPTLIKDERPDVVGISGLTKNSYMCMGLAKIIKQVNSRIVTVFGGTHFSLVPQQSLSICKEIDYIAIGEGEITFLELIRRLEENKGKENMLEVEGLAYLIGDDYIQTQQRPLIEDLDILPFPAYYLLPMNSYGVPLLGKRGIGCTFSRGCVYNCKFCSESILWRNTRRGKSAKKIIDELELLVKEYKKKTFWLCDDDFMQSRRRNVEFLEGLENRNLDIRFSIYTRADVLIKNRDLLKRYRNVGLSGIIVGIESYSQQILDGWNKQLNVSDIEIMSECVHSAGIPILETDLIFGNYEDNKNAVKDMIRLSKKINTDFFKLSLLVSWPGTKFFEDMRQKNRIKVWDYRRYDFDHAIMNTRYLSVQQLEKLHSRTVAMWWLHPFRLFKNLFNHDRRLLQFFQLRLIGMVIQYFLLAKLRLSRKKANKYDLIIDEIYSKHLDYIGVKKEEDSRTFKSWTCRE